jgi:hypothetical protein
MKKTNLSKFFIGKCDLVSSLAFDNTTENDTVMLLLRTSKQYARNRATPRLNAEAQ